MLKLTNRFTEKLESAHSYWDGDAGVAVDGQEAKDLGIYDNMTHVLVRSDGWSIACREVHYDMIKRKYSGHWRVIYILNQ